MPEFFQIDGLEEVMAGLDILPELVGEELAVELPPVMDAMAGQLAIYPAERAGQRYQRTGTLGRGWTNGQNRVVRRSRGAISLRRTNPVPYVDYVQGADMAWFHKGRWTPVSTVEGEYKGEFQAAIERACNRAAKRAFKKR